MKKIPREIEVLLTAEQKKKLAEQARKRGEEANSRRAPQFQLKAETRLLAERMKKLEVGEILKHSEIEEIVGGPLDDNRHRVSSAIRIVRNEKGVVIGNVLGEGYTRLTSQQVAMGSPTVFKRVGNAVRRTKKNLDCVKFEELDDEGKRQYLVSRTLAVATVKLVQAKSQNLVAVAVGESMKELAYRKTYQLVAGNGYRKPIVEG